MAFSDTFDPAGMLVYNNQVQEMKLRNRLYEMQYNAQERAQHEAALRDKMGLDQLAMAYQQQQDAARANTGIDQGGPTPTGNMTQPTDRTNPMEIAISPSARIASVHNNPGNLMYAGQPGATQGEPKAGGGYWAKFETPQAGYSAAVNQVELDQKRGLTIGQLVNKYAPPSENNTLNYTDTLTKQLGVNPNTPASQVPADAIARSIVGIESGTKVGGPNNMVADASGRTVPPSSGMEYRGQPQQPSNAMIPPALQLNPSDSTELKRAKVDALDKYQKQQQGVLQNVTPVLSEALSNASSTDQSRESYVKSLDEIAAMYKGQPYSELALRRIEEMKKIDPSKSGGQGNWAFKGTVTEGTIDLARYYKMPEPVINALTGIMQKGGSLDAGIKDFRIDKWDTVPKTAEGEGKNKTTYQRARDSLVQAGNTAPTEDQITAKVNEMTTDVKNAEQEAKDKGINIPALVDAMADGDLATYQATGSMGNPLKAKIEAGVREKHPKFDFTKLDANAKWDSNPGNQRTQSMIQGALPRLSMLNEQAQKLGNTQIPIVNRVKQLTKTELGSPEYTNFESNRNAIVQEINTALSGSAQSSDMRIKIELENIKSARSPAQLHGAINNLNEALLSRLDSSLNPRWPLEVVRGEKTVQDYTKEIVSKYRGKFGAEENGKAAKTIINQGVDKDGKKVVQYSDGTIEHAD